MHGFPLRRLCLTSPAAGFCSGCRPRAQARRCQTGAQMHRREASPVTSMASFHHLLPSSLWTNTRAQGRDLSEVHHSQREGNYVAARLLKTKIHYRFWLAVLAELKDAAIVLFTAQRGLPLLLMLKTVRKSWGNSQAENKINRNRSHLSLVYLYW